MTERRVDRSLLEPLGLGQVALDRLAAYLDHLAVWNRQLNLTGLATDEDRVRVLIRGVLPALAAIPSGRLIDVGSGNGSPGLVFAAIRDDLEVTLLEPRLKRWAFLRDAARAMGRVGIEVRRQRHDEYDGPPAATVVLRALKLPLAELAPLIEPGGQLLAFGELPPASAELASDPAPDLACHRFRKRST